MKIVYFYPHFIHLAGTERILIDKMNYLSAQKGIEVFLVTHEQGDYPLAYPIAPTVKHIDLDVCAYTLYKHNIIIRFFRKRRCNVLLQTRFNNLMATIMPDVVIATTFYVNILSLIDVCPVHFKKVLESHIDKCYIHCNDPVNRKNLKRWFRGILDMEYLNHRACRFDILVSLHQKDADDWSKYLKTTIIPNIVHLNRTGRYCNLSSKRVIFVGRYTIQKGIPELFQIWEKVFLKHPDWHLDMYGDGGLGDVPYTVTEQERVNIHVHQADYDIFSKYLESSIFVLTSVYEPFGLVIPEAMSCGLPVVSFDCPYGPASIITDGVDGFLIKSRNVNAFADKICQLIESRELRMAIGKAAILSSQKYSAERVMPQWIGLFNELIKTSN